MKVSDMNSDNRESKRSGHPDYSARELAQWCAGEWFGGAPREITGVSHDTRTLESGNIYFALKGDHHDGHRFLEEAFRKGAAAAVVLAEEATMHGDGPLLGVEDPGRALRDTATAYRLKLDPHIIAVTGSAGKSTVKEMTACMAAQAGATARTRGNWNNEIGLPLSLLSMPAGTQVGVFEIGMNHPGEIADLCRILKPSWGIVTNIGPVHMEFFKSVDDIADEKAALLRSLPSDGLAILNREGGFFDMLNAAFSGKQRSVSRHGNADYLCTDRDVAARTIRVRETRTGEERSLHLPSVSEYNIQNTLLAVAAGRELGLDWDAVQCALDAYEALPMRWQESIIRGVRFINDAYNANPLSMRASLRAFAEDVAVRRRILVLGGMRELGAIEEREHVELGAYVGKGDWDVIVTVGALGELIARGVEGTAQEKGRLVMCADNAQAAAVVARQAEEGDAVLLKGSRGMQLEQVIAGVTQQWGIGQ
jgi:UDP-N-acetylmuramoyl-tripeptide--D-alanyl-D-alanine ligase